MRLWRRLKLNAKILVVFFATMCMLSVCHFFVYMYLFDEIRLELQTIGEEQMYSASVRLDSALSEIPLSYSRLSATRVFQKLSEQGEPDSYELVEMQIESKDAIDNELLHGWVVFFRHGDQVMSNGGSYTAEEFLEKRYHQEHYDLQFWMQEFGDSFSQKYYPAKRFRYLDVDGSYEEKDLVPMAFKSYWHSNIMTVFFLDMEDICRKTDAYFEKDFYIFSNTGSILYSSEEIPEITELPQEEIIGRKDEFGRKGSAYVFQCEADENQLIFVKLLSESVVENQISQNYLFCLGIAIMALLVVVMIMLVSVKKVLIPVNKVFSLLQQHAEPQSSPDTHTMYETLEGILRQRVEQAAALAEKDHMISEYCLSSRIKNVYVDMETKEPEITGETYILYIRMYYKKEARTSFVVPVETVENCFKELMARILNGLFETSMIFQLEPRSFVAKVSLDEREQPIEERMKGLLKQLENESDYAFFTVVQSEKLVDDDLAAVYNQVLEAERYALVNQRTQLLTLPLSERGQAGEFSGQFEFSWQEEKLLTGLVKSGDVQKVLLFAGELLENSLKQGISHMELELLCMAIVNTLSYSRKEQVGKHLTAAGDVYQSLTSSCGTAEEYCLTVNEFIRESMKQEAKGQEQDPLLQKIHQFLEENYQREFSSEEMADALYVSRSYLSTFYKTKTGENLSDSIQFYRIRKAEELLKDPKNKISDIGSMVGISSNSTFLRQFKKYTGMTPNEYRRKVTTG